jgi:hypothetical protein
MKVTKKTFEKKKQKGKAKGRDSAPSLDEITRLIQIDPHMRVRLSSTLCIALCTYNVYYTILDDIHMSLPIPLFRSYELLIVFKEKPRQVKPRP